MEILGPAARAVVLDHVLVQGGDGRDLALADARAGQLPRQRLERTDHREQLVDVLAREPAHHRTAVGNEGDQAVGGEHLERLAHGCARDAEALAQLALGHLGAGLEPPFEDDVAQALDQLLVQGPAADGLDVFERCHDVCSRESRAISSTRATCSASRPAPPATWWRQEVPSATMMSSGAAARTAGSRLASPKIGRATCRARV